MIVQAISHTDPLPAQTFRPISIITRAQLPLAYLDTNSAPGRLFKADIQILEPEEPSASYTAGNVLLAQNVEDQRFYAVERVERGVYALCKIGHWVDQGHISSLGGINERPKLPSRSLQSDNQDAQWWNSAAVLPPSGDRSRKAPRLAMSKSNADLRPHSSHAVTQMPGADKTTATDSLLLEIHATDECPDITPGASFSTLLTQYLDMLYCSKTSLAYFAKGPMSRIRAAFNRPGHSPPRELAVLLRTAILSSSTAEKKYRDALPELLRNLPLRTSSDQEPATPAPEKRRKRKNKLKPDKQGILPDEGTYFAKWWREDDSALTLASSAESLEQQLKRRSVGLRTRETFLQIILVLEIIALELKHADHLGPTETQPQDHGTESQERNETARSSRKEKKAQDLKVALDLLLDKLCIWHSLDQGPIEAATTKHEPLINDGSNQLRNFCVEVIVPFYSSRVPDQAAIVNKKLGGPTPPSPVKARTRRPADAEEKSRRQRQPRDPLQRVTSETMNHSSKAAPSLARSATDSLVIPGLKRERSETPLDQIPRKASQPTLPKRTNILDKMRFAQREVDLDALSQAQETKKKKQAEVDMKLREAIGALKKPNRALAGKEIADVAEQRTLMAQGRARTSQSSRSRHAPGVQIGATPKHNRTLPPGVAATPQYGQSNSAAHPPSASTVSLVPSSSMRQPPAIGPHDTEAEVPQTGHRQRHTSIEATPSRGPDKFARPSFPASGVRPFSLAPVTRAGVPQTPTQETRTWRMAELQETPVAMGYGGIAATPVVSKTAVSLEESKAIQDKPDDAHEETNIYDALGWND